MIKVGIITLYYKNYNYGGLLQAFALQTFIEHLGYYCEQISFRPSRKSLLKQRLGKMTLLQIFWNSQARIRFKKLMSNKNVNKGIHERYTNFCEFMNYIPHSECYDEKTIFHAANQYDVFVCGSDQIWNPGWWNENYFLAFVPDNKKKIAYSASVGRSFLSPKEQEFVSKNLNGFSAISVREEQASLLLTPFVNRDVTVVLDPTLLLEAQDWSDLSVDSHIEQPYAFSYMFGHNSKQKEDIYLMCQQLKIKLVTIPYPKFLFNRADKVFNDIQILNAGPREWLGLIRGASYVFTDSFHGTVFSIIFHKKFLSFKKNKNGDIQSENDRITNILKTLDLEMRLCGDDALDKITAEIDYDKVESKIQQMKLYSENFLSTSLKNKWLF